MTFIFIAFHSSLVRRHIWLCRRIFMTRTSRRCTKIKREKKKRKKIEQIFRYIHVWLEKTNDLERRLIKECQHQYLHTHTAIGCVFFFFFNIFVDFTKINLNNFKETRIWHISGFAFCVWLFFLFSFI